MQQAVSESGFKRVYFDKLKYVQSSAEDNQSINLNWRIPTLTTEVNIPCCTKKWPKQAILNLGIK